MTQAALQSREGQTIPDVSFQIRRNGGWATVTTDEMFAGKNVIVFSTSWRRCSSKRASTASCASR
jgi:peroxiredoxin